MGPKKSPREIPKVSRKRSTRGAVGGSRANKAADISPALGEMDLHLFGEGKHERIYEKLGAHATTHEGKRGVAFAVWAPNAKSVRVVGDFNGWDSGKNPMRSPGGSGIWELFIPRLKEGALYKYAIKTRRGEIFKADPYASMMQMPPDTSSIVYKSRYKFQDRAWITKRN
ncbi:MAG TPA: hypothetical protein VF397_05095, partial [Pyrinomonadaceae bacterium]